MRKILLATYCLLCLNACSDKPYAFEGTYHLTEGEQCTLDVNAEKDDAPVMEIIAHGQGKSKFYVAKIPVGAAMGLPTSSNGNSSPTEKNELNFSFSQEGKTGFFGGKPSIDMTVTVVPHESKKDFIWLKKWDATATHNGMIKHLSLLQEMQKGDTKASDKGICLSKKV